LAHANHDLTQRREGAKGLLMAGGTLGSDDMAESHYQHGARAEKPAPGGDGVGKLG